MNQLTRAGGRSQTAYETLRKLAYATGPGQKLPTHAALCQDLAVSKLTLDKVMVQLEREEIITRRQGSGIFVSPKLRKNVVLLCDPAPFQNSGHSPFWEMLIRYAQERAHAHSEELSCHFTRLSGDGDFLESGLKQDVMAGRVHGIVGVGLNEACINWVSRTPVPLVSLFSVHPYSVEVDSDLVITMGVEALAAQGCRSIGYFEPCAGFSDLAHRKQVAEHSLEVFRQALRAAGIPFEEQFVRQAVNERILAESTGRTWDLSDREQGFRAAMSVLKDGDARRPDGILVSSDNMTQGVLPALSKLNIKAGHDVQIASHANQNSEVLVGHEDELILVEISPREMVRNLFEILDLLMAGKPAERIEVLVKPTVIVPLGAHATLQ